MGLPLSDEGSPYWCLSQAINLRDAVKERNAMNKPMTQQQRKRIIAMHHCAFTASEIAERLGLPVRRVHDIIDRYEFNKTFKASVPEKPSSHG